MTRTASASRPPSIPAHLHDAGVPHRSWTAWQATLLTALVLALSLPACNDAGHLDTAVDALKSREKQIQAREEASLAHDRALADKERQLADTAADLAKQREEIHQLRLSLDAEIIKARQQQEAALRRERRGPAPKVQAERVIVVDAGTGEVLFEKNADRKAPVASTQKLLTALLLTEDGNLDQILTVEPDDTKCAPVRLGIKAGEQYPRRQLLTALLVKSSNDIAQALARDNAGTMDAFVKKMNARAAELGMKDSRFLNPHGLPADGQYSTARDMARVALTVDAVPDIRRMISTKSYVFKKNDGSWINLENTNRVLRNYAYCDGMKTGYAQAAGYCLISSGEKDNHRRIVVVLSDTSQSVWKDSQSLLEWSLKG